MNKQIIKKLNQSFEKAAYQEEDIEYWMARELQLLLEYDDWRNFLKVIEKAQSACKNSGEPVTDHFVEVNKMVDLGSGSQREIKDIMLTRYACYLIAQNGDPRKESIAFAQSYFALQTRKQELVEDRIALTERLTARRKLVATETELSKNIYERGVDDKGFGRIRSKGDQALFGGLSTIEMKKKLSVPENRPIADFLPTITIKAKDLATEITNYNVKNNFLYGEDTITDEHVKNNKDIREVLAKSNIKPEELPPEENLKKLERRIKSEEKKLSKNVKKLADSEKNHSQL